MKQVDPADRAKLGHATQAIEEVDKIVQEAFDCLADTHERLSQAKDRMKQILAALDKATDTIPN